MPGRLLQAPIVIRLLGVVAPDEVNDLAVKLAEAISRMRDRLDRCEATGCRRPDERGQSERDSSGCVEIHSGQACLASRAEGSRSAFVSGRVDAVLSVVRVEHP